MAQIILRRRTVVFPVDIVFRSEIGNTAPVLGEDSELGKGTVRQEPDALLIALGLIRILVGMLPLHGKRSIVKLLNFSVIGNEDEDGIVNIILAVVFLHSAFRDILSGQRSAGAIDALIGITESIEIGDVKRLQVKIC